MDEAGSSSKSQSTPKKKRDKRGELSKSEKSEPRKQAFSDNWRNDPAFSGWLDKVQGDRFKAKCICCDKVLSASKTALLRHGLSNEHIRKAKAIKSVPKINEALVTPSPKRKQMNADFRLCLYFVEHNISFQCIDHFVEMAKAAFPDSKIIHDMKLKRSKLKYTILHIAETMKNTLKESLQQVSSFSIFLDESTDVSNKKHLCILIQYISHNKLRCEILDYVTLEASSNAETLFNVFKNTLSEYGLQIKDMVGVCSDNANVMVGKFESFKSYCLKENPNIIYLGCICHLAHLVASDAADVLPKNLTTLVQSVYTYFSRSPQRQAILEEFQAHLNSVKHKMIRPADTRWLALAAAVRRLLEQWNVLENSFTLASFEDKNGIGDIILAELKNPFTKAYIEFLDFILPSFNTFNALFQSKGIMLPAIIPECHRFMRLLCQKFLQPKAFENILKVNPISPGNLLPLDNVEIGENARLTLSKLTTNSNNNDNKDDAAAKLHLKHQKEHFRKRCLLFYQEAVTQCLKRLPLMNEELSELRFLTPSIAIEEKNRNEVKLDAICKRFAGKVNITLAKEQFNNLPVYFSKEEKDQFLKLDIFSFWNELSQLTNYCGEKPFKDLCDLAKICLVIPHSNAAVERVFSQVCDIKTKKRNKINRETMLCLLRIKHEMQAGGFSCFSYPLRNIFFTELNKEPKDIDVLQLFGDGDEDENMEHDIFSC